MPVLQINYAQGLTFPEIFSAFQTGVLPETPNGVGGDARVQTAVAAKYDIDRPVHSPSSRAGGRLLDA